MRDLLQQVCSSKTKSIFFYVTKPTNQNVKTNKKKTPPKSLGTHTYIGNEWVAVPRWQKGSISRRVSLIVVNDSIRFVGIELLSIIIGVSLLHSERLRAIVNGSKNTWYAWYVPQVTRKTSGSEPRIFVVRRGMVFCGFFCGSNNKQTHKRGRQRHGGLMELYSAAPMHQCNVCGGHGRRRCCWHAVVGFQ